MAEMKATTLSTKSKQTNIKSFFEISRLSTHTQVSKIYVNRTQPKFISITNFTYNLQFDIKNTYQRNYTKQPKILVFTCIDINYIQNHCSSDLQTYHYIIQCFIKKIREDIKDNHISCNQIKRMVKQIAKEHICKWLYSKYPILTNNFMKSVETDLTKFVNTLRAVHFQPTIPMQTIIKDTYTPFCNHCNKFKTNENINVGTLYWSQSRLSAYGRVPKHLANARKLGQIL